MTTLKDARKKGKLEEFIREHEKDALGDEVRMDKIIKNMAKAKPQQEVDTRMGKTKPVK